MFLLLFVFFVGCIQVDLPDNPLARDDDGDGYSEFDGDCDDRNPEATFLDGDRDCDGVKTVDDCNDGNPNSTIVSIDGDCDGVVTIYDCDDSDPSTINDMDCDDILTIADCDDSDPSTVNDMDCDGVVTVEDCDDSDSSLLSISNDMDCDGVVTVNDCDDGDPNTVNDMDCDGVVTIYDCDDSDANIGSNAIDTDCNGVFDDDVYLDLGGGQSIDFVLIPSGTFMMGSPSTEVGRSSDETQRQVTLTHDFYVMTTEVTQGMFYQLMGYQAYDGYSASYGSGADYPAYYVSWHMAAAYANAVTQRHNSENGTSLQACYTCSGTGTSVTCTQAVTPYTCTGYRLLTEVEWEYTARAGDAAAYWTPTGNGELPSTCTSTTYTLTNGFDLRQYAWYYANHTGASHPIAQKIANDYGVYDMSGNVWEWVHDYYGGDYATSPVTDPVTTSGSNRVLRGGSWFNNPSYVRCAQRSYGAPTDRSYYVGFRLGFSP